MKRLYTILCLALLISGLAGCGGATTQTSKETKDPGVEVTEDYKVEYGETEKAEIK